MKKILFILLLFLTISSAYARDLEEIKRSGKIYIAFTSDDIKNINYPLAQEFARYLNVQLVEVIIDWEEVFMQNGVIPKDLTSNPSLSYTPDALKKADIICSTFTILEWRKKLFDFGRTLSSAELLLIRKDEEAPKTFNDLKSKTITFQRATTFEQHLQEINEQIGGGIIIRATESGDEAKRLFIDKKADGIVLDADEALNFNASHDYQYKIALPVSKISKTAWAVEKNNPLKQEVENFFETIENSGVLNEIFYKKFKITYTNYQDNIKSNRRNDKIVRDLDEILASKKLVVALRDRNFIYHPDGQKQFMHALAEEFADYLGVTLEVVITPYFTKYWEDSDGVLVRDSSYTPEWFNYFDVACELFSPLDWRSTKINMVPVYPSTYAVIALKETEIYSIDDLKSLQCVTGEKTVYEEILQEKGLTNYYYAKSDQFMSDLKSGKADYAILENADYELLRHPELENKLALRELDICWGLRKNQTLLEEELNKFIAASSSNGLIKVLMKSLQGNTLQSPEAFINSYYESFQTGQLPYVNYGANEGLPQEDIFSIFQDKKGYVWFGTNSGAVRYNGREMIVYDESNGLPANSVRDIKQDTTGRFFLATTNGIAMLQKDSVKRVYFTGISFKKIFVDSKNKLWFIGDDGIYTLDNIGREISLNSRFPELPNFIYGVTEDIKNDIYFIATSEGVFLLEEKAGQIKKINDKDCFSVFIDINDSIWLSTKSGLYISHVNELIEKEYESELFNLNERLNFSKEIISDITTNNYGSVWLISDSKIFQVISTDQAPIVYEQEIGIKNNKILSFLADKEDNIWIGFSGGLQRLTNRKGLRNFYPTNLDTYIYSIFQDQKDRIWIISNNGIYYFTDELTQFKPKIGINNTKFLAAEMPNGNILLANSFGVYELNTTSLHITRNSRFPQLGMSLENIFLSSEGEIFLLTGINGVVYYLENFYSQPKQIKNKYTSNLYQLTEYRGKVYGGSSYGLIMFEDEDFKGRLETDCNVWSLLAKDSMLWLGTDCGLGKITNEQFSQLEISSYDQNQVIKSIVSAKNKNYLWLGTNKGFSYYNLDNKEIEFSIDTKDGLSGDEITTGGMFLDNNDLLWIGTYHGISNFNIRAKTLGSYTPVCYIENLFLNGEKIDPISGEIFKYNENNFIFEISALSFTDEKSVEYEFYLRGVGNNYSSYHRGKEYKAYYNNLPAGHYEFIYKAKGKNNLWGYAESYRFTVKKAWYHTWIFRICLSIVILGLTFFAFKMRLRAIEAQKKKLEMQVKERTIELEEANTEIEAQRDLATEQRDKIAIQQKEIVDSIHYAQKIQESMLPSKRALKEMLPEHFILFKPRDIVSGDFYWASEQNGCLYFTAADCTGHGVPGAFMSMLGMGFLNEIVNQQQNVEPDEIMNQLRKYLIKTLHQKGESGENKDGMDMVMCKYDKLNARFTFATANNPLLLVRNGELTRIKGDPMPVAIHERMDAFSLKTIDIIPGDCIYIFSDGYADQFGGPKSKKLMSKQFMKLILEGSNESMEKQGRLLEEAFNSWKGQVEQIDDVVVIGIRF